jgi:hypothetical protein
MNQRPILNQRGYSATPEVLEPLALKHTGRRGTPGNSSIASCRRSTSSTSRQSGSNGLSRTIPTAAFSPGCARDAILGHAASSSSISRPKSRDCRIRVPFSGVWRELLNTDAAIYGGTDVGNAGAITTLEEDSMPEVRLAIPPLAALFFVPER